MKKKPSHPMLRKYTVTIEEQIVQEFPVEAYDLSHALETAEAAYKQGELVVQPSAPTTPPDHGTAQQDRKNDRVERILAITTRER